MTYSGPRMKLRANVRIPARVVSGPGISQEIADGTLTTGLDLTDLADAGSISDPSQFRLFIYNDATDEWEYTTLDNVPTTTTGDARTGVGDAAYVILNTDRYIALTATLTAPRIWSLPAASAVPGGTRIRFHDEAGGISSTNTLTFGVTGADTINGASTFILNAARAGVEFRSNGSNAWSVGLVTDSQLRPSAALSVLGRSSNTAGTPTDITAGTDGFVLYRSGTSLVFGQLPTASLADKAVTLAKQADVATGVILGRTTAGTGVQEALTPAQARTVTSSPAMASGAVVSAASQASMDWTSIPAGTKRIDVSISGLSTNGTSPIIVQIGDSGGVETSGYLGTEGFIQNAAPSGTAALSSGFIVMGTVAATSVFHGVMTLVLLDASTNTWSAMGVIGASHAALPILMGGSKSLSATLDRVRLTTAGGADTFDAGKANILYFYT